MKNKVLLIDDSITIHRVIDLSIDLEKYEIVKVFSQEAASAKLKELNFDFILLDNKLENTVISDYIKEIKLLQPASRVILLVGAFDKFDPEDSSKAGADDYLVKPFDSQSLNMKLTLSPASPAKQAAPKTSAPGMSPSFVNNIPQADAAREQQIQKPTPPTPVNRTVVFHDPSEDPVKGETKEKPFFQSSSNPFEEEPEKEENPNAFDPASQFEELGAGNDEEEAISSGQGFVQENTFGTPVYDTFEVTEAGTGQSGSAPAFTPEKTFVYGSEPETNAPKIGTQNDPAGIRGKDASPETWPQETPTITDNERESTDQAASDTQTPVFEFTNEETTPQSMQKTDFGEGSPLNFGETEISGKESVSFDPDILSVNEPEGIKEEEKSSTAFFDSLQETPKQEEEFYQLDEEAIFNKSVSGIFEEEILSLDSPEKDKNENDKPIAQKFEEEILSIDDPGDGSAQQTQPDNGEPNFFDPASLEDIGAPADPSKPIAQKFEEEILSLGDPEDKDEAPDGEGSKNIQETFEEEILSLGTPKETEKPDENTDYLFEHLGEEETALQDPIEAIPFTANAEISLGDPFAETAAPKNMPFGRQEAETQTFSEKTTSESDDLFSNETLTKEFADEIFPMEEGEDAGRETGTPFGGEIFTHKDESFSQSSGNFSDKATIEGNFQALEHNEPKNEVKTDIISEENSRSKATENDLFSPASAFSEKSRETGFFDLTGEQKHRERETAGTTEKNQNTDLSASMDDTLNLDELLNMDLTENKETNFTGASPQKGIEEAPDLFETDTAETAETFYMEPKAETPSHTRSTQEKTPEDTPFDLIQMDASPAANENINLGDNIFSGITVTISKEEIMKMLGNAIDKHFLEKAVQEVLAQNMREIVRAVVPAIAEKFIKEEIEKLKDGDEDI